MKTDGLETLLSSASRRPVYQDPLILKMDAVPDEQPEEAFRILQESRQMSLVLDKTIGDLVEIAKGDEKREISELLRDLSAADLAADPKRDQVRAWMSIDWIYRRFLPAISRAAGFTCQFETLPEIRFKEDLEGMARMTDSYYATIWQKGELIPPEIEQVLVASYKGPDEVLDDEDFEFTCELAHDAVKACSIADSAKFLPLRAEVFSSLVDLVRRQASY